MLVGEGFCGNRFGRVLDTFEFVGAAEVVWCVTPFSSSQEIYRDEIKEQSDFATGVNYGAATSSS